MVPPTLVPTPASPPAPSRRLICAKPELQTARNALDHGDYFNAERTLDSSPPTPPSCPPTRRRPAPSSGRPASPRP
ncbi:MAG: hypothetical protein U1F77_03175 [Kiritimatiellia bacterium]